MGIIGGAARVAVRKDIAKEAITKKIASTKQSFGNAKQSLSNFYVDPKGALKDKYDQAKLKALQDIQNRNPNEPGVIKKGVGAIGKGTLAVGAAGVAVGAGIGAGLSKIFKKSDVDTNSDDKQGVLKVLLFISILIHMVDLWFGVGDRPNIAVLAAYGMLALLFFIWVGAGVLDSLELNMVGAIALGMIVPRVALYLAQTSNFPGAEYVGGVVVLLPVVPIYIWSKIHDGGLIDKFRNVYWFGWGMLVLLVLVTSSSVQSNTVSSQELLAKPWESVGVFGTGVAKTAVNFQKGISTSIKMMIAQATGQKYEGDQESFVGLELTKFVPVEKNGYYTDSDVYLQASLKATNIKEKVTITTKCFVPDTNISGYVEPEKLNVQNNDGNVIDCHLGSLPAKTYNVKMVSTFEFHTDADIVYYFVDEKTRPEMYTQLKIPEKSTATYTGGPVEVGLPSLHQPLRVSMDVNNPIVGNYVFGASLINKWSQGNIVRGSEFILEVPDTVRLSNCTRKMKNAPVTTAGRRKYTFDINSNNLQETFDSVSCRMHVDMPDRLFSNQDVVFKTFSAKTTYVYAIETETYVTVKDTLLSAPT